MDETPVEPVGAPLGTCAGWQMGPHVQNGGCRGWRPLPVQGAPSEPESLVGADDVLRAYSQGAPTASPPSRGPLTSRLRRLADDVGRLYGDEDPPEGPINTADAAYFAMHEAADSLEALRSDLDEAVRLLREAREMVVEWSAYASDYFTEKWDLAGDLAKLDAFLAGREGQ